MKTVKEIVKDKNYTAIDLGNLGELMEYSLIHKINKQKIEGKVFIKDATDATGTEISFNSLAPKAEQPYFHIHKKNEETFKILTGLLFEKAELLLGKQQAIDIYKVKVTVIKSKEETVEEKTMTDDHLDAYIAWLLGTLWLKDEVILVGNKNTGAMLLPKEVSKDWQFELGKYK